MSVLTPDQQNHVDGLGDKFKALLQEKYKDGAGKGNLWEVDILPLLYEMRSELIDGFVYLQTAIDEIEKSTKAPKGNG